MQSFAPPPPGPRRVPRPAGERPPPHPTIEEQVTVALAAYRPLSRVNTALLQYAGWPVDLEIEVYIVGGGDSPAVKVSNVVYEHPRTPTSKKVWTVDLAAALLDTVQGVEAEMVGLAARLAEWREAKSWSARIVIQVVKGKPNPEFRVREPALAAPEAA